MDGSEGSSGGKSPSTFINGLSVEPSFFKDISYCIHGSIDPQLVKLLETGGAKKTNFAGVGTTHVFAGEGADKVKLEEAQEVFEVPVVSPLWILGCASLKRIIPLDGFNGGCNQLFSNIYATSSGIRRKDKSYIWSMITFHGGKFNQKLTNKCTHLITLSTTSTPKYLNAKRLGLKVVTPDWIYQSVKNNSVSEERMFDPDLLLSPNKESPSEEVIVKVQTKPPPLLPTPVTAAPKVKTLSDSNKPPVTSTSNILQNKLMSQPQHIRMRAPGDIGANQLRMVQLNQTRMQQPVLTPTMQQQLQNASPKNSPVTAQQGIQQQINTPQQVRLTHTVTESQNLNDGQRYMQWQQQQQQLQNKQQSPNLSNSQTSIAQPSQLQNVQGQMQQQQILRNNASPAPLGSQQTLQNQQILQGQQHPLQPAQNKQQLLQGHPQQTHHQMQPQNIQQQPSIPGQPHNQAQLHPQGHPPQMQLSNSHQIHPGQQMPNQQQGPQPQQMRQVTQMQQSPGFQQMGQMQPPGHIPSQHPQHQNQQQLQQQNVQQMHSPQHMQSSQKLQSPQQMQNQVPQQLQSPVHQQMQSPVHQQMQSPVHQHIQSPVHQQMLSPGPQQLQGQVPQQMQGQISQHMQGQVGQMAQQMQGQVGQLPQQMQGQVGQIQQQMQGQVGQLPQQMQGQVGQLSQQMQGQVIPQQMQGQVGQLPQQMQGQIGQLPQMQGQVGQLPQMQGQLGQLPLQMQGQVGQIPQQMQGPIPQQMQNQIPQQLQGQVSQQMQNQGPQQVQANQPNQFQQGQIQFQNQNMQQMQFQNQNQVRAQQQQQRQFNPGQVQQQQQIRVALPVSSQNQPIHFQVVQQQPNRPQMMINQGIPRGQYQSQGNVPSPNNPMNQQVYRQQQPNQIQFHPIQQTHRMQSPDQQQQQHSGNQLQQNPNQLQQNSMNQGQIHQMPGHYNVVINQFPPNSPNAHQSVNNSQMGQPQHQPPPGQAGQYTRPTTWTAQHSDIVRQASSDPEFAAKFSNMDPEQRQLFLQQLIQTRKNESMRQEMMQRQQHMNQQSGATPQPPPPIGVGQSPQRPVLGSPQSAMGSPNQNLSIQQQNMQTHVVGQTHGDKQMNHVPPQNPSTSGQVTILGNIQQTQGPIGSQQQQMILQGHQVLQKTTPGASPGQLVQVPNVSNQQTVLGSQSSPGATQQKFLPPQIQTRLAPHGYIGSQQTSPQVVNVVRTQIYTPQIGQQQQRVNIRHNMQQQSPGKQQPRQHLVVQGPGPAKMAIMSPGQQQGHLPQQPNSLHWSPTQRMVTPGQPTQFQNRLQSPEQMNVSPQQTAWNVRPQNQPPLSPSGAQPSMSYVQVVNSKTKTALANLLSNRLQGSAVPESNAVSTTSANTTSTVLSSTTSTQAMCPPPPPPVTSQSLSQTAPVTSQTNIVVERRTLANITNGSKTIQVNSIGSPRVPAPQVANSSPTTPPRPQFYGHDPQQSIPPDKFLLGCVFWQAETSHVIKSLNQIISQHGGDLVQEYSSVTVTHVLCETQTFKEFVQVMRDGKRVVTLHWLNDICTRKMLLPPYYAIHLPVPFKFKEPTSDDVKRNVPEPPLRNHCFATAGFNSEDRTRVVQMLKLLGAEYTNYFSFFNTGLVSFRSEGGKYQKAREWRRPVVCLQFLNELMLGHQSGLQMIHSPKYQNFNVDQPFRFDINLALGLMAPWKNPIRVSTEQIERLKLKRRSEDDEESSSPKIPNIDIDEEELISSHGTETPQDSSDLDQEAELSIWKPIVLISGYTRRQKEQIKERVELLGGKVTNDYKEGTHLLVHKNTFTMKLFYAICRMRHVVDLSWLKASCAANKFVDEKAHIAVHQDFEVAYDVSLAELMMKPSRRTLFKDMTFHITPGIVGHRRHDLINLIGCAGGTATMVRTWTIRDILSRYPKKNILVTCVGDFDLCKAHLRKARRPHLINICYEEDIWQWIASQKITLKNDANSNPKRVISLGTVYSSDTSSTASRELKTSWAPKRVPTTDTSAKIVDTASSVNGCSSSRTSEMPSTNSPVPNSSIANQSDSSLPSVSSYSLTDNNHTAVKTPVKSSVSTVNTTPSAAAPVPTQSLTRTGCDESMDFEEDSSLG